jgi:hypothetical protein
VQVVLADTLESLPDHQLLTGVQSHFECDGNYWVWNSGAAPFRPAP